MAWYETKIGKIINEEFDARVELSVFYQILETGIEKLRNVTDEQIEQIKGNALMTDDFCRALFRCAVRICKECEKQEIIEYIRLNLHCVPNVNKLWFHRDNYTREMFDNILYDLDLEDEEVGEDFCIFAVVDKDSLKEV